MRASTRLDGDSPRGGVDDPVPVGIDLPGDHPGRGDPLAVDRTDVVDHADLQRANTGSDTQLVDPLTPCLRLR